MTTAMPLSINLFATWEPMIRLLRDANAETVNVPGGYVSGRISQRGYSVPFQSPLHLGDRGSQSREARQTARQEQTIAVRRVKGALWAAGIDRVSFKAGIAADGHVTLRQFVPPPAMEYTRGFGAFPATLVRYAGAQPEPARHLPDLRPEAGAHPSADLELLERVLRERFPGTTGATEEELAAAERRLGLTLPAELRTLYRVMCELPEKPWEERGEHDHEAGEYGTSDAMFRELIHSLGTVYIGDAASRHFSWDLVRRAVITPPGAAVQQLVGSPGWIIFGDDHGSNRYAVDLTPGPGGHVGQVITIPVKDLARGDVGAHLKARSLTDFVQGRFADDPSQPEDAPVIARAGTRQAVESAVHPDLEVLTIGNVDRPGIGAWEGEPLTLASFAGLPKLRTLRVHPGALADPLEIAGLTHLEYLELGPAEWRTLLDAGAVPGSLLAAMIIVPGGRTPRPPAPEQQPDPVSFNALANEILALWGAPQITETVIEGQL